MSPHRNKAHLTTVSTPSPAWLQLRWVRHGLDRIIADDWRADPVLIALMGDVLRDAADEFHGYEVAS